MKLFLRWIFVIPFMMHAEKVVVLSDASADYSLEGDYVFAYKDANRSLNFQDALLKTFTRYHREDKGEQWRTSDFWLRVTIQNNFSDNRWILEIFDFGIQEVEFYDLARDSAVRTGYSLPFHTRSIRHKNFAYPLDIPIGETRSFLIKVSSKTGYGPVMKIRSEERFISYATKEYLVLGLYYGLLILIAVYNFFLFVTIRDYAHLSYFVYVLAIAFRSLQGDGIGFQYLWPEYPIVNYLIGFAPQVLLVSFVVYAIIFLELKSRFGVYYRAVLGATGLYLVLFVVDLIIPVSYIRVVYLLPYLVVYGVSIRVYLHGVKSARYFVLGYSIFIISQFASYFLSRGLDLSNDWLIVLFVYSVNIGFVVESYVFSLALVDKFRLFKKEKEFAQQMIIAQLKENEELKDKVNQELELRVQERTAELEVAKRKLQEQADEINRMNGMLDKENFSLKSSMQEINRSRGFLKTMSFEEFSMAFPDDSSCYRFMEELKWGEGFLCQKCSHNKYSKTTHPFSRKCSRCSYIETIKANTVFHNVKFPITKAFALIYLVLTSEISSYELADRLKLQQKTCWAFRQKVLDKIKRDKISRAEIAEKGWSILILGG